MRTLSQIFPKFFYLFMFMVLLSPSLLAATVPAGRVIISRGSVSALNSEGATRSLKRGDNIFSGETIKTAADAEVQLRFTDDTLVSLSQASEFKVKNYQLSAQTEGKVDQYLHQENATEANGQKLAVIQNTSDLKVAPTVAPNDKMIVALAKGGLRMVTGAIGQSNPSSYQIGTTVGTIGVRGTYLGIKAYRANSIDVQTLSNVSNFYINLPNNKTLNIGSLSGFTYASISHDAKQNITIAVRVNPWSAPQTITMNASGTILHSTVNNPQSPSSSSGTSTSSSSADSFSSTPSATNNAAANPISQSTGEHASGGGGGGGG